jgi:hypothetical protein
VSEHYSRTLSFPQHKVRGLTIVNRILALTVIVSAVAMIALFSQAVSRNNEVKSLKSATENAKRRTLEIKATSWCDQITSENADKMSTLFRDYDAASSDQKLEIERQCKQKVTVAKLISSHDPTEAFIVTSECTVNESEDTASCTATVTPNPHTLGMGLSFYSATTATLRMRVADTPTNLLTDPHVIDNVATMTLDSSGSGTTSFDVPFDINWGTAYDIQVTSYFPNE